MVPLPSRKLAERKRAATSPVAAVLRPGYGKGNKDDDGSATEPQTRGMKEGGRGPSGSGAATDTGKSNKDQDGSATEPQTRQ